MKKIVFFAAIAAVIVVFSSCSYRTQETEKNPIVEKVAAMEIDSCQCDRWGDVFYFAEGDIAVQIKWHPLIVGDENISITQTPEVVEEVRKILTKKCPSPEPYASVSLRHFKQILINQPLDSSSFYDYYEKHYNFYLKSYKVSIAVVDGEMWVSTNSAEGESVMEYCSITTNWSYEQQQEILQLLLGKEEEKK